LAIVVCFHAVLCFLLSRTSSGSEDNAPISFLASFYNSTGTLTGHYFSGLLIVYVYDTYIRPYS
jgi:hypothetical protein